MALDGRILSCLVGVNAVAPAQVGRPNLKHQRLRRVPARGNIAETTREQRLDIGTPYLALDLCDSPSSL